MKSMDQYCPITSMHVIHRECIKSYLFPFTMLFIIVILIAIRKTFRLLKTYILNKFHYCPSKVTSNSFSLFKRYYIGYYVVLSFTYQKIASLSLELIHCVKINESRLLYIYSDVECINSWQIANIFFIVLWVAPFPFAVMIGYQLLKKEKIKPWIFLVCLLLPVSIFILYLLIKAFNRTFDTRNTETHESKIIKKFEEIFEEAYEDKYWWWECWRLIERLFISVIVIFEINPIIRIFILSPVIIFLLWFHYTCKPFKKPMKILYRLDVISFMFLCLNLIINCARATIYFYDLPLNQYPINTVLTICVYFEEIFSPLWWLLCYLIWSFLRKKIKKN